VVPERHLQGPGRHARFPGEVGQAEIVRQPAVHGAQRLDHVPPSPVLAGSGGAGNGDQRIHKQVEQLGFQHQPLLAQALVGQGAQPTDCQAQPGAGWVAVRQGADVVKGQKRRELPTVGCQQQLFQGDLQGPAEGSR
jgi:hypothetical protein